MNFLYNLYFSLPNFALIGIVGKAINRVLGMILKRIFDAFVPAYLKRTAQKAGYGLNTESRSENYIVSLTSFPARIEYIWITIETILRQSFKPDKIILWLAEEQFKDKQLPKNLTRLKERGLSIEFCEDLRSHKKYYFAMQRFPNHNIITVDDDVHYPENFLKHLVSLHLSFPTAICANRAHKMTFANGVIKPYRNWKHNHKRITQPSPLLVQVGVGGVLYPSRSLSKDVFQKDVFQLICFHADDLWLKIMALKNETFVVTNSCYNKEFISVGRTQKEKLVLNNVFGGGNDKQLNNVLKHFDIDLAEVVNKPEKQSC